MTQEAVSKIKLHVTDDTRNKNLLIRLSLVAAFMLIVLSIPSHNFTLTIVSFLPVPFFVYALWRPSEPSVLFFAVMFQWLSITIKVFYGNLIGEEFAVLHKYPQDIVDAFYLNLYGLVFLVLGIFLAIRKVPNLRSKLDSELVKYDTKKVIIFYLLYILLISLLIKLRFVVPGLFQGIVALSKLKLGFVFLVIYISILKKEYRLLAFGAVFIEIVFGFLSFFSNFKEIIIIGMITLVAHIGKISARVFFMSLLFLYVGWNLGVVWTSVKGEYRSFLAGGERSQKVVVSNEEALYKLMELISNRGENYVAQAEEHLISRISYIDNFSACLGYVPEYLPHEDGAVWWAAVTHMFTPRLLFPNKPAIDDSQHLMKYTGMRVADASMGTSISLGYMGDSYIDFGRSFMIAPIFLLGLVCGLIYKNLFLKTKYIVWGYVLIIPFYEILYNLGTASVKLASDIIMYFLVALLFRKFVITLIDNKLRASK